jgi:hypothetical protein
MMLLLTMWLLCCIPCQLNYVHISIKSSGRYFLELLHADEYFVELRKRMVYLKLWMGTLALETPRCLAMRAGLSWCITACKFN